MAANWSELPDGLLQDIFKRLIIPDHLSFISVCSSWKSAVSQGKSLLGHKFVGLVVPGKTQHSETRRLLQPSLHSSQYYFKNDANELNVALPHRYHCCGSNYGWLILVGDSLDMHLFNPFTRSKIQLPSVTTANPLEWRVERAGKFIVDKAFLSHNPSSSPSETFLLMIYFGVDMAFCRLGDDAWTCIKPLVQCRFNADAVYYKDKFYVVYNPGGVVTIDIHSPSDEGVVQIEHVPKPVGEYFLETRYLVESEGELFQIRRTVKPDGETYYDSDGDGDGDANHDTENNVVDDNCGSHHHDEEQEEVEDNIDGHDQVNNNDVGNEDSGNHVEDNAGDDDGRDQVKDIAVNSGENAECVEINILSGGGEDSRDLVEDKVVNGADEENATPVKDKAVVNAGGDDENATPVEDKAVVNAGGDDDSGDQVEDNGVNAGDDDKNANPIENNILSSGCGGNGEDDSVDQVNGGDADQNANRAENNVLGSGGGGDKGNKEQVEKSIRRYRTIKLKIFKLRQCCKCTNHGWERVKSIGDRAFFLGYNGSFSVSASEFLGCRPNSIYFTDNVCSQMLSLPIRHDIGVYNLEDNSFQDVYPIDSTPVSPPAFWFGPFLGERI